MAEILEIQQEVELYGMDWYDPTCYATEILDAKYGKVATDDYVEHLDHLTPQQKKDLNGVLNTYTKLFDGTLGVYPHRKFQIDLWMEQYPNTQDHTQYQSFIWKS